MKAGAVGGIETVLKTINTHIGNVGVCRVVYVSLFSMVFDNGKIKT